MDKNQDGVINRETDNNEVTQIQHSYPFGMSMNNVDPAEVGSIDPDDRYTYNGKEFEEDWDERTIQPLWLMKYDSASRKRTAKAEGWHNYGARFYDPAIARFTTIDPLAEQFPHQSGYVYADNDPIGKIDFMGLSGENTDQGFDEMNRQHKPLKGEKIVNTGDIGSLNDLDPSKFGIMHTYNKENGHLITNTATSIGISGSAVFRGGLSFELGVITDSYGDSAPYFRVAGELGFGGGLSLTGQKMTGKNGPLELADLGGQDFERSIDVAILGYVDGGDQGDYNASRQKGGFSAFTDYGKAYNTEGMAVSVNPYDYFRKETKHGQVTRYGSRSSKGGLKKIKPSIKASVSAKYSFGVTYIW